MLEHHVSLFSLTIIPLITDQVPAKNQSPFPSLHFHFSKNIFLSGCHHTILPIAIDKPQTPLRFCKTVGMAVTLGNISAFLDLSATPHRTVILDRKPRVFPSDAVLNLFKKDLHQNPNFHAAFESIFDHRERNVNKRKSNQSKVNEVEYENSSDDENGNGFEDELGVDDGFDWEMEMRKKVKEIEEMRELEKKAEELQYKVDQEYGDGEANEETEEQKRMRVKKELEKVYFQTIIEQSLVMFAYILLDWIYRYQLLKFNLNYS